MFSSSRNINILSLTIPLLCLAAHPVWAQDDFEDQINNEEVDNKRLFVGKEHLDIYLNEHVHDLMETIEASDRLSLVYIFHSEIDTDSQGQNWRILDLMFLKVLEELNGGYVTTYAIDCAAEFQEIDPKVNL